MGGSVPDSASNSATALPAASGSRGLPCRELVSPIPLSALAVLFVNDHFLKGASLLPGVLTGKLSDFAGLFCLPLLLTAVFNCSRWLLSRSFRMKFEETGIALTRRQLVAAISIAGAGFALVKMIPAATAAYVAAVSWLAPWAAHHVVTDPTDLVALAVLPFNYWYGQSFASPAPSRGSKPKNDIIGKVFQQDPNRRTT